MSEREKAGAAKLAAALHEVALYGIGATRDTNQKIIVQAATQFAALPQCKTPDGWQLAAAALVQILTAYRRTHDILDHSTLIEVPLGRMLDLERAILSMLTASPPLPAVQEEGWREPKEGWQREVLDWAVDKFGPIALDRRERAMRFVEEAIELAQAEAVMGVEVSAIVDRVFSRAQGYTLKEIAQAGLTLEALAENIGTKVAPLIQQEIDRIKAIPKEEWQRRHAAKQAVGIALPSPPRVAEPKGGEK